MALIPQFLHSEGSDNPKVVNTIAKNYDLARTDSKSALTFLHCNGDNKPLEYVLR
jgi:hypothetical protein